MKKKLIALVCALALAVGLVGCSLSTPDSVGPIGEVDIPSGLYLLAQFDAYQTAADLASDDQDATKVSSFLKATITVDDATGETAVVSDYVAQKTLENLESYAAIETRFDELGGVLTPDEETQADSYASQLMEQNGDLYKANGIGLDTLKRFERILIKSNDLLEMYYGTDGETPVSDAELTSHLEDEMVYIRYVVVPLYNTSTFAFADDDQSAQMLELAQTAAESCNAATPDGASAQTSAFSAAVAAALPDIYAVLDGEPSSDASSLSTALLGSDNIDATFSEEGTADAVRALKSGEAAAVQYSSYALMMLIRLDPLDADTLGDMEGFDVIQTIRRNGVTTPVIIISGRNEDYDFMYGLSLGADDYVTKPFRPQILGAKVKALIRRSKSFSQENNQQISCGPFLCDTTTMRFYKNNVELNLSEKERSLLLLFVRHPQQVFTKDMIYEQIWGNLIAVDDNAIMVYINRLRSKIEDNARTPQHIITIRGVGYRFVP